MPIPAPATTVSSNQVFQESRRSRIFILALLCCILTPPAYTFCAEPEIQPFNFETTQTNLKNISRKIKGGQISPQQLDAAKQETEIFAKAATTCIDTSTGQISRLDQEIESLGPVVDHEPAEIVKERKNLSKQKQAIQVTLSECRLVATLITRLQNELADKDKLLQTANFFSRDENFFDRFATSLPDLAEFSKELQDYLINQSGLQQLTPFMRLILLLLAAAGSFAGFRLFKQLQGQIAAYHKRSSLDTVPLAKGLLTLPVTLATMASGGYFLYVIKNNQNAVYGPWLLLSAGLYSLALFLFYLRLHLSSKESPAESSNIPVLRFSLLALLCVVLFFFTQLDLTEYTSLSTFIGLTQSLIVTTICLVGWWLFWPIKLPSSLHRFTKTIRLSISVFSVGVIIISLSGYGNFSIFLLVGLLGTVLLAYMLRFTLFFIDEIIGGVFTTKYQWQQRFRQKLGLSAKENLMGITWIRLLFKLLAWSIALLFLLQLWGLSDPQLEKLIVYLADGISIGGLVIAPARIAFGVFIFACGWTLISWIKIQLEKKWLKHAAFSLSAKETLVTMTGYIGFALALIIGLSIAGFSFSNLAVIAGALSVGIGFGMQNIVNNFVSGLIILFERPVKRGDWISIGNTEGYVRKISVRSTLIQTFDRSDVIVPNSELISNQVTNMMLNDNFGRLKVPIGVAYGSDTDLVRTILLDIAEANDQVVTDGSAPKPQVLFLDFGDNSLMFELRCHLVNVDQRITVKSDINYEIDRAFRKHNISIPFPQRDLYIKEFPAPKKVETREETSGDT